MTYWNNHFFLEIQKKKLKLYSNFKILEIYYQLGQKFAVLTSQHL